MKSVTVIKYVYKDLLAHTTYMYMYIWYRNIDVLFWAMFATYLGQDVSVYETDQNKKKSFMK